jgi:hypothetical protein
MRSGNHHEGTVELVVLCDAYRDGQCPHTRKSILDVPGLEVRVPEELLPRKGGLEIHSALVDVDRSTQNLLSDADQATVSDHVGDGFAESMRTKDGPDGGPVGLENGFRATKHPVGRQQLRDRVFEPRHLDSGEDLFAL